MQTLEMHHWSTTPAFKLCWFSKHNKNTIVVLTQNGALIWQCCTCPIAALPLQTVQLRQFNQLKKSTNGNFCVCGFTHQLILRHCHWFWTNEKINKNHKPTSWHWKASQKCSFLEHTLLHMLLRLLYIICNQWLLINKTQASCECWLKNHSV